MPQLPGKTVSFEKERDDTSKVRTILEAVYAALE
ncbi:MAG TPA: DUF965 domain-containing protein, partial [Syntrophomonas sp.]|nr:DUF965 domain-containing protein [Syntrophomonas sp.]